MSIRAYRVTKLEHDWTHAFNSSRDSGFMAFLDKDQAVADLRNRWGQGLLQVHVEALQRALDSKDLQIDETVRKTLQADLAWAESRDEECVTYYFP